MSDRDWLCPVCFEKKKYGKRVVLKKKDDQEKAICRECNRIITIKTIIYLILFGISFLAFVINTFKFFKYL